MNILKDAITWHLPRLCGVYEQKESDHEPAGGHPTQLVNGYGTLLSTFIFKPWLLHLQIGSNNPNSETVLENSGRSCNGNCLSRA